MRPDYFPAALRRGYRSEGSGPMYKIMDQFDKMTLDVKAMSTKKVDRICYYKIWEEKSC